MSSITVESKLIEKAVNALLKWQEKQEKKTEELIEQQDYIYCIVTLAKMPSKLQVKPIRIPLKHSIHQGASICVISKDPQSDYKPKLDCKVIGVSKLKQKYKAFEEKRLLSSSYDLFLADKRVLPVLPRLLGKSFFLKKKQPIPIDLTKDNLKQEVLDVLSGTFLYLNKGTCCSIKVGKVDMNSQENSENVMEAIQGIAEKVPGKWNNIQAIHLKTNNSTSLPIYQVLPEQPQEEL